MPTPASRRGPAIRASATATFIALKPGLLTGDGVDLCGDVSVHALGLDPEPIAPAPGHRLDWTALAGDAAGRAARGARATCTRARSARSRSSAARAA